MLVLRSLLLLTSVVAAALPSLALNASCHNVVFQGRSGMPLFSAFHHAKMAFHTEHDVCFVEQIDDERRTTHVLFYPKHDDHSAKSCLLPGLPSADTFPGPPSATLLVAFINERANTLRLPNGQLSPIAPVIRMLEANLYRVTSSSPTTCRRIDAADITDEIFRDHVLRNEPLVITRSATALARDPAWSTESLLARIGRHQVHVKVSPNSDFEGCEPLAWWQPATSDGAASAIPEYVAKHLESPDKVLVRPAGLNMPFAAFVARLRASAATATSYYLEYLSMAAYVPELVADAPTFSWVESFLTREIANLWFGDGKSVGKLHFDPHENVLTMVAGAKTFVLMDPSDNTRLYEGHIREAQYDVDGEMGHETFHRRKLMESTSMVNSPVDVAAPDLERYPRFAHAQTMTCTVGEGDSIYVPAFWWHEVQSAPAADELRNVAINYWYTPVYKKDFPCKTCRLRFNLAYESVLPLAATAVDVSGLATPGRRDEL
ncbi:Aste57867_13396 [Aphanomyces stellatus]|uniref:Aste57867_13396 protein n=1 Tax=Aphanomyces stellatus TaxID=120398 RepID=A0A485KYR9_9STRA|nr:hypothetical protein As57867_013346 [Aphanomyces stellatus]VFT90235.1 Aste57867_13396 [Aphanomyces stellatus]